MIYLDFKVTKVLVHPETDDYKNVIAQIHWVSTLTRNGVSVNGMGVTKIPAPEGKVEFTPIESIKNWTPWIINNMPEGFVEQYKQSHEHILKEKEEAAKLVAWIPSEK
jgi:hypothetical protein